MHSELLRKIPISSNTSLKIAGNSYSDKAATVEEKSSGENVFSRKFKHFCKNDSNALKMQREELSKENLSKMVDSG